ncbi:MAG: serine hydrolase domain-containing protein [Bacteroidota bacterium]
MADSNLIESSYLARYFLLNKVDITDYQVFPSREIRNAPPVFHFPVSPDNRTLLPLLEKSIPAAAKKSKPETIDQFLARNGTTAFLVIRKGELLFERYYNGYDHSSICTSFSTAKSFVSALIGIALQERLIGSLDDPLTNYLPQAPAPFWNSITIRHLVSMSSGLQYREGGFLPWDDEPRT